uniref:Uncharacterized protein n=1 Tax=Anguilla anguilla TaxID=7936 RepID=A0A0E9QMW8_ANGAN
MRTEDAYLAFGNFGLVVPPCWTVPVLNIFLVLPPCYCVSVIIAQEIPRMKLQYFIISRPGTIIFTTSSQPTSAPPLAGIPQLSPP